MILLLQPLQSVYVAFQRQHLIAQLLYDLILHTYQATVTSLMHATSFATCCTQTAAWPVLACCTKHAKSLRHENMVECPRMFVLRRRRDGSVPGDAVRLPLAQ